MSRNKLSQWSKNILGRDQAQEILNPHMPELMTAAITGLERYAEIEAKHLQALQRRTKKGMLNDYIVDSAIAMLDGVQSVVPDEQYKSTFLIFEGRLALRYKYVVGSYRTSNVRTKRQLNVHNQQLQLDGFETLTTVTFGYTLNAAWQEFIRTRIFCRHSDKILWHIPIYEAEVAKTLMLDTGTSSPESGPVVSSVRHARKEG